MTPPPRIGAQVRRGVAVTGGIDVLRQLVELASGIALARLLRPEDFGIVAVVMSFIQISHTVGNLGMGAAVVQTRTLEGETADAAFTVSTFVALGLTLAGVILAPFAATFFHIEALAVAMPILSLQVLLAGLSAVPIALLRRDMKFGRVAMVEGSATFLHAGVGIGMALAGYGFWSLVWAPVAAGLWTVLCTLVASGYRPRFSLPSRREQSMLRFGGGLTLKNVFVFIGRNMDNLIVARMLGEAATGIYTRAFNLTRLPQLRVVNLVYQVSYPAFCRLRDDGPRFHAMFERASRLIALAVAPILLGLAAMSEDFILGVLGPQWAAMTLPLQLLAGAALVNSLHTLVGAAIEASGRVSFEVFTQGAYALMIVVGTIIGARSGIEGVSYAVLVSSLLFFTLKAATLHLALGVPMRRLVKPVLGPLFAAGIMFAAVRVALSVGGAEIAWLAPGHHVTRLMVGAAVGAFTYIALLPLLAREHLKLLVQQFGRLRTELQPTTATSRFGAG